MSIIEETFSGVLSSCVALQRSVTFTWVMSEPHERNWSSCLCTTNISGYFTSLLNPVIGD